MVSRWSGIGLLVVISSPSGGGKSTVIRELRRQRSEFLYSVSVTTRSRRQGERNGAQYRFIDNNEFARLRKTGALAEWARVHDHYYGTPKANLLRAHRLKRVMLFDLDVQGAAALRRAEKSVVSIFLQPPSMAVLRNRLLRRGSEDSSERRRRLAAAKMEMKRRNEYDYLVTNDRLNRCVSDCVAIIRVEMLRTAHMKQKL